LGFLVRKQTIWQPLAWQKLRRQAFVFLLGTKTHIKNCPQGTTQLRTILNFTPGPQGWNMSPRGNVHPFVHPWGEQSLLFRKMEGEQIISPPGDKFHPWRTTSPLEDNFTPWGQLHPWRTTSPLEDNFTPGGQLHPWVLKFAPRGKVKNGPLDPILRSWVKTPAL
jgi:hypothetical protein